MLDKLHSEYCRWLKAAEINQANYVKSGDQRAIAVGEKSIARIKAKIAKLEAQGACQ